MMKDVLGVENVCVYGIYAEEEVYERREIIKTRRE